MNRIFAVAALLAAVTFLGCGPYNAAVDCHSICSRYSGCYDPHYDISGCESRCRSHSADDTRYRESANLCSACIEDRACFSATFTCGLECGTVVP